MWRAIFSQIPKFREDGKAKQAKEYEKMLRDEERGASAELLAIFQADRNAAAKASEVAAGGGGPCDEASFDAVLLPWSTTIDRSES